MSFNYQTTVHILTRFLCNRQFTNHPLMKLGNYVQLNNFNTARFRGVTGLSTTKNSTITSYDPAQAIQMERIPEPLLTTEMKYSASDNIIAVDPSSLSVYRCCTDTNCNLRKLQPTSSFDTAYQCSKCRKVYSPEGNVFLYYLYTNVLIPTTHKHYRFRYWFWHKS